MKKKQIHCPYCGAKASLRPASAVYGTATKVPDSYLYVCDRYPRCDSYVGAHKRTKEPMGTLANGDLRNKRIQAHKAFDWMWKSGLMTKWQAYKWMQGKLALTDEQAMSILKNTINMLHELDMQVVICGINPGKEQDVLQQIQCDYTIGSYQQL